MTASAMRPEEVPAELANLGGDGLYVHLSQRHAGPPERPMPPGYIARARAVLAAALPAHEKQLQAEIKRLQLLSEWANAGLERLERERDEARAERDDIATIQDSLGLGTYSEELFVRFLALVRDDPKRAQALARKHLSGPEDVMT